LADVDIKAESKNAVDIVGLDNIKADLKLDATNTYDIKPLKADNSYDIKPLSLEVKPLKADYTYDIKPLETDNSYKVDLKPVTLDLCMTANIGKIPDLCVRQPYRHRLAFTLYGVEVWGLCFSGEQEMVLQELDRRPQVALGGAAATWPPPRAAERTEPPESGEPPDPRARTGGGLRIRIGP